MTRVYSEISSNLVLKIPLAGCGGVPHHNSAGTAPNRLIPISAVHSLRGQRLHPHSTTLPWLTANAYLSHGGVRGFNLQICATFGTSRRSLRQSHSCWSRERNTRARSPQTSTLIWSWKSSKRTGNGSTYPSLKRPKAQELSMVEAPRWSLPLCACGLCRSHSELIGHRARSVASEYTVPYNTVMNGSVQRTLSPSAMPHQDITESQNTFSTFDSVTRIDLNQACCLGPSNAYPVCSDEPQAPTSGSQSFTAALKFLYLPPGWSCLPAVSANRTGFRMQCQRGIVSGDPKYHETILRQLAWA